MDIRLDNDGEIEYIFHDEALTDSQADIAAFILNVMKENHGNESEIIWILVDELDLTIGEAKEILRWKVSNFEKLIMEFFD